MSRYLEEIFQFVYPPGLALCLGAFLLGPGCSKGILEKMPVHEKIWMCNNQADEVMKEHDYDSTILLLKRFLKKMPTNGLALYHLRYPYDQTGNI